MHTDIIIEDRFKKLEDKLTEIRRLLLGSLLLAKEIWKDELKQKGEGSEIIKAIEEGEEAFLDSSLIDSFERFDDSLNVIHKRAKGIFLLVEAMMRDQGK